MPLTGTGDALGGEIKAKIESALGAPITDAQLTSICNAIGEAVVAHILANALLNGTVGSGPGAGGTVTGNLL